MNTDLTRLEVLGRAECKALLASVPIGRIVFTDQALPAVLPVNFVVDDEVIVVRTGPGSKLAAAARNAIVAFQADDFDAARETGWSVTVVGHARLIRDPDEIARLTRCGPRPWVPGDQDSFIGIEIELVTGRKIELPATFC